ncbi:nuclear transport factor 2 family protein [Niallia circulans]|uniref:nuclear transport factor 2 family protein n=1 Tax=Niallia circulans TaxID=1397 RepID=UPI0015601BB6|nr:nuclear transport factor 2 family protein [Niallia circulans]NRG33037.1 nuclear transport factor 2 family protein [Niallia circulans]
MKKKSLATAILSIIAVLSLAACATKDSNDSTDKKEKEVSAGEEAQNISNADKAVAVLESLESGDSDAIKKYIKANDYTQHNLTIPDGRQVMLDSLEQLKEAGTKVEVKRVLTDDDLVAVHSEYNLNGPKAGVDIFRFENGKIVEHWDNLQELVEKTPSGHTMLDGATQITDEEKTEENKKLVKQFVEDVLMGKNPDKLTSYFDGDNYIQHNPSIADGLSGLGEALEGMAEQGIEMKYNQIHMVVGQGNFVLTVSEGTFGGEHTSYYDLFRVENGKIAEHWDVLENILPEDQHKNNNGKF